MNIYQTISIILGTSCAFLGISILYKNKKNKIIMLFIINCLLGVLISIAYVLIWWTPDKNLVIILNTINIMIVMLNFCIMFHFFIEFTGYELSAYLKILIYIPGIIVSIATIFSKTAFSKFTWHIDHWSAFPPYDGIWGLIFLLCFYIIYPFFYIFLLAKWSKKSNLRKNRIQARIIIYSYLVLFIGSFFTDFFIHIFGISSPPMGPLFGSFYIYGIFYCLIKYRFLTFDISDLTEEIISNINDFVIVLNAREEIININVDFSKKITDQKNIPFKEVIVENEALNKNIKELADGRIDRFRGKISFKAKDEVIFTDSYLSRIVDKIGDFVGILVISKEITGIKHLKKNYKITDRQFEIINLAIQGLSNNEIAEKLNITKRTADTHLNTIFNKLSIKNKIELMKIAKEFNLI